MDEGTCFSNINGLIFNFSFKVFQNRNNLITRFFYV